MLAHQGTVEGSNADGFCCINSNSVNVLTKGQGGAILSMEDTNLQELKKKRKWNQQGVSPVV